MRSAEPTLRVLALVPLPSIGAANRLRVEQYAPVLRGLGIELDVSAFLDEAAYRILYRSGHVATKAFGVARGMLRRLRDAVRVRRYDLVLIHRESAPIGPPVFELLTRALGVPYVYDFDDALFLGAIHPANRRWAWLRDPSRVSQTVRLAKAVIAGNDYLAEWARQRNPNVTVIPTPVDPIRHHERAPHVGLGSVIGWVGSSTTAPYLHLLDGPLAELTRHHRDLVVRIVGGEYTHPVARIETVEYDVHREPSDVAAFDIGVLPEPDDPWTRGKGAFKALVYMAAALPVVASRVGVNSDVILDGRTGLIVDDDEGWIDALDRLIRDPEMRESMGRAGRARLLERYSVAVQAPRLARVIRGSAPASEGTRLRRRHRPG
jgi:glycosyltransferase involved in cell wall biosynthesis